ncbi:L-lactate dehydrogenase [Salinisphaera hydrothermalis]|uniref:L-lactate dehydrogenase n=1 Tax=Salinisphaera hydrothermalis (strain C41B8) TaxID=1304275 RepID=A0A084IHS8_SALHC|nr:L-lactate dehydrogenase [Salinisphaera hydrothermalis]KEZ76262.1 L-lactate dehydrogenase [Salinisphaera hydrothermalis C41B8]
MTVSRTPRIVIIGAGAVGADTAYTLYLRERAPDIVLVDIDAQRARGEALDMQHGQALAGGSRVRAGNYADCAGAAIVIITAGAAQKPGQTREALLERNADIMATIVTEAERYMDPETVLLIATNPVDTLAQVAARHARRPASRVIGSGTVLDSARLRWALGEALAVDARHVHAHVIGEHGDSELVAWSHAHVAGAPIELPAAQCEEIARATRNGAYEVIAAKGHTSYAIALSLDRICAAILNDDHAILTVSTHLDGAYGIDDLYLSVPCVVGRAGIERVIELTLNADERAALARSAAVLRERIVQPVTC